MENLMEGLLNEITRVTEIKGVYESVGPAGMFAAKIMETAISIAKQAISEGDTIKMMYSYNELKEFTL